VENNGICEESDAVVTPKSPVAASVLPSPDAVSPSVPAFQSEMISPPLLFPTPPPSLEGSPVPINVAVNQTAPNTIPGKIFFVYIFNLISGSLHVT
jgi:hypothetical protein